MTAPRTRRTSQRYNGSSRAPNPVPRVPTGGPLLILDIGCGKKKQVAGAIGLDRQPGSGADVLCELMHFPWPLRDSCADLIYLSHFIEHQSDTLRWCYAPSRNVR